MLSSQTEVAAQHALPVMGRLLTLIEQLRSTSQLIVITHQKRSMEIADALYGVSMRGDGITGVISQRLRELETA